MICFANLLHIKECPEKRAFFVMIGTLKRDSYGGWVCAEDCGMVKYEWRDRYGSESGNGKKEFRDFQ